MKKNQPTPSSHPSVKELIQRYKQAVPTSSAPQAFYTQVAPPKPPRTQKKNTVTTEKEIVYATLDFSTTPHHSKDRDIVKEKGNETLYATVASQKKTERVAKRKQKEETLYTTVASQRTVRSLSEKQITQIIPHNPLVRMYQEQIQYLCQTVYGNRNILQEKIEQIQKNPSVLDGLSWQITAHPASISKLAGVSVCGIKNSTRQHAEDSITSLSGAVDCYIEAVLYARKCLMQSPDAELKRYEKSMSNEAIAKILQTPYNSERERDPLSNTELANLVQGDQTVQRYHAQIQYWCKTVFGKPHVLQEKTEELLTNPSMGEKLTWQLAAHPQSFHRYAGVSMCGFKNSARKHAEEGLSSLIEAVDNYANAVKQIKENIVQPHQTKHQYHVSSVKLDKNVQKQQDLSHPSRRHEHVAENKHEVAETSRYEHQRAIDVRPRKTATPKAVAFAS
ncbi:hypothetical protein MCO_01563 [Bartonella sp. DB5-6]|uniref:BID domain-containing T4SS effector n=1 Tax=Bartonella sp. DB5-6 TaxID=1094755 RepID=UPI00026E948A|nr:BID domain-containing T4SS effector [Bartonella sp. DB5-6]EJF76651.1 hypothetical protein MCO_01563 [Bartonella sp. DB5-6]